RWTPAAWSACPRSRRSPATTAGSPEMILLENLHKSFRGKAGTVHAVKGVGFEARDGEITGLLGPNGAGKTTTLRMLYTLMAPEQGRIEVDGIDVARDPAAVRRRLGVLPDARGIYKRLTARENIAYFGRLHGLDEARSARAPRRWRRPWRWTTSSTAAPRASARASAPRPRSRAPWSTIRAT